MGQEHCREGEQSGVCGELGSHLVARAQQLGNAGTGPASLFICSPLSVATRVCHIGFKVTLTWRNPH